MARRNRFVSTETVRLDLSEGDWVDVKERLSYAEQLALSNASIVGTQVGGGFQVDMGRYRIKRLEMYLTDWNFTDAEGKSVPLTSAAIRHLDSETAEEILAALDAQEAQRDADPNDTMLAESPSKPK